MGNYFRFYEASNADSGSGEAFRSDHLVRRTVPSGVNPGLTMFDLRYRDTDHHVHTIMVGAKTGDERTDNDESYVLGLSDSDHGRIDGTTDYVSLRAKYMHVSDPYFTTGSPGKASGTSTNQTGNSVSIPALGEDQVFVLRGFYLWGTKNRNHELREIGVRYDPAESAVKVQFIDNSPRDDEYDFAVHYFVLDAYCRPRSLNYCLVPVTDRFSFRGSTTRPKVERGHGMLAGFNFRFDRGDRHLHRLAVDVSGRDEVSVSCQNKSGRQLVHAAIDYVVWDSN